MRFPHSSRRLLARLASISLLASILVVPAAQSVAGAAPGCTTSVEGSALVLNWQDEGARYVIRRNGSWVATPGKNSSSFTDTAPIAGAIYELVAWTAIGPTTTTCQDAGVGPVDRGCLAEVLDGSVSLTWADDGGSHVLRRNGSWLASPGSDTSTYVDQNPIPGAAYLVRTRIGDSVTDRSCRVGTPTPPLPGRDRRFVVHVSLDGLRADQVEFASMPTLNRLANEGASTMNARTDPAITKTLPNHTSQFTGRFIWGTSGHRITVNEDPGVTVHDVAGGYVSSVFDVVHDNGGRTVVYTGKAKFELINRSWGPNFGAPDITGEDNGRDKIDVFEKEDPALSVEPFVRDLIAGEGPTFGFFHIRTPDSYGHTEGWLTPGYADGVEKADANLQALINELEDVGVLDQTTLIVTSDHGGPAGGTDHSNSGHRDNFTVPFVVWGLDVGRGLDLYEINATRVDPGFAQINRSDPQPIRGHDAANLALSLLGLPAIPGSVVNADQRVAVTE